jgi:hypothetical protein
VYFKDGHTVRLAAQELNATSRGLSRSLTRRLAEYDSRNRPDFGAMRNRKCKPRCLAASVVSKLVVLNNYVKRFVKYGSDP